MLKYTPRVIASFICLALLSGLTACSVPKLKMPSFKVPKISAFPGVYKIDIQQGNVISQEMIDQLRPGMTKKQVQFVMGTPLIQDTFDQNRWDYVYSLQPGGEQRQQESVTFYFDGDKLTHFEGDFVPTGAAN